MTPLMRRLLFLVGILASIGSLAPLGYALLAVMEGRLRWVGRTATVIFDRTSDPAYFWIFTGILLAGGVLLLWAGLRTAREFRYMR